MGDQLSDLLDLGEQAVGDLVSFVRSLEESQGDLPTDLAGWSVRDVVAHTAHLEAVLAGAPEETVEVPEDLEHVRGTMGTYTEQGVIARRDRSLASLADEIEDATARRTSALRADPPDLSSPAPGGFGALGWTWQVLLGNRPLDVWVHEQDLRHAVGRSVNLDCAASRHVVATFTGSFGLVVAKRAKARPGQVVALEITDDPERVVVTVDENGRGVAATVDTEPDVTLRMDTETYVLLSAGRRDPAALDVEVSGDDSGLAERILGAMALTP
ncbi:hypothetical protein GCM10011519_19690 [Marmoricola endophyticus]|uniref:Maleylpyruvate isomerase family mycothiol-dependent enzyme n=1 Tax=Marmoricola endophyticus TaxID=2040280 RepID=A0A917BJT9_9ACTN|nr:maleylpyruvate isomerase family mycothiol-dependent enzyme [Marmoricola endophyticus]GGF45884.1 hypothetical protein GCM10011519_19690 [Marmoricola endophyticus]